MVLGVRWYIQQKYIPWSSSSLYIWDQARSCQYVRQRSNPGYTQQTPLFSEGQPTKTRPFSKQDKSQLVSRCICYTYVCLLQYTRIYVYIYTVYIYLHFLHNFYTSLFVGKILEKRGEGRCPSWCNQINLRMNKRILKSDHFDVLECGDRSKLSMEGSSQWFFGHC